MSSIPEAEIFLEKFRNHSKHYADQDYDEFKLVEALKEYSSLHVQAALKAASEKAILSIDGIVEKGNGQSYFVDSGNHYSETQIEINKDSILNAYPLTNIK